MKFRITLVVEKDGERIEAPDQEAGGLYECDSIFEAMQKYGEWLPLEVQWRERGMELLDVKIETVK